MSKGGRGALPLPTDPLESAQAVGLRYVSDALPGIRRRRVGRGFTYIAPDGTPVRDRVTLDRIRKLAIPPAWTQVWICPLASGHLQATGRDAKGRKQHRYHLLYRAVRDEVKFSRMAAFAAALPRIRKRIREDLSRAGVPREKVLAAVVRLLEITSIRVGNDEYARDNDSFGLTTMRDHHARISGSKIRFRFRGKSGKWHEIELADPRLARIVKRCQDLPGEELFQFVNDAGEVCDVDSGGVNDYLREISGEDFTAKDFRTWNGTVLAAVALGECEPCSADSARKKNVVAVVKQVAERLGNRPATCRKYYVHPAVFDAYATGELLEALRPARRLEVAGGLTAVEACVARLLETAVGQPFQAAAGLPPGAVA